MPITHGAKKKLHQDKKRRLENVKIKDKMKKAVRNARINPTAKNIQAAYSELDTAVKNRTIHKNKAARLKSRLTKNKSEIRSTKSEAKTK